MSIANMPSGKPSKTPLGSVKDFSRKKSDLHRAARGNASIPFSMGMVLVTLGVVYGDIGTSPMYTMKAIMEGNGGLKTMSSDVVLGALSLLIWTITLITTVKYVLIAMKADNHNEGGIFALYSLVRHCSKWLLFPAMVGGAALLADGILTPAVTVTTAIEGLRTIDVVYNIIGDNQHIVIGITITLLCALFMIQRAGTSTIGKAFGPVMTLWFGFLAAIGLMNIITTGNWGVLRALNPMRGVIFLFSDINAAGLMVLGNVFLCTTGAEALYSDMGHVGKSNIYASWPFVKLCLIFNYLGQGAFILANRGNTGLYGIEQLNPFFEMVPENLRIFAVILSTLAAIIASQALITGSFSIVSEAIHLDLMPHLKIIYPSNTKGQLYIPLVNAIIWIGCIFVVLLFRTSSHMEAAYGLAITATMLMTTVLLFVYLHTIRHKPLIAYVFLAFFIALEAMFFVSSLTKFLHGGYFTVLMAAAIFFVMYVWRRGTAIERTQTVYLPVNKYIDQLRDLSHDESYPLTADNLVFLTNDSSPDKLDRDILYSILNKQPKRARAYYFLNVKVTDEPRTLSYSVNNFGTDFVFKVQLRLGFRVNQRVNQYLYQIVSDLVGSGQLAPQPHRYSIYRNASSIGDFRFCMLRKEISPESEISGGNAGILTAKYAIRRFCGSPARWYGLENSSNLIEYVPLFAKTKHTHKLTREPYKRGNTAASAPVTAIPEVKAEEEENDVFSDELRKAREEATQAAATTLIGGDTASFQPLVIDEDVEDDDLLADGELGREEDID
ncbi:KUP/HAK/KT family potassium transporter [Olegusella massiliensis]|uniref:KUP/HAK/KT family potassium transporter n=1 Tax=Olegusella massiliensis TaxID=1776381 RepID=UPI003C6DE9D8